MKKTKSSIRKREEGYALVENMIVMPIVFLIIFALLFTGFMLHAQCTLETAARRGVRYAAKQICDPQYAVVTAGAVDTTIGDLTDLSSKDFDFTSMGDYKPYRYIPLLCGNYYNKIETNTREYVQKLIDQNITWMFTMDTDSIICEAKNYVVSQNVKVEITAVYHMPRIFSYLGLPETYELKAADKFTVSDQDEFIRNVDFAADLLDRAAAALKVEEKIGKPLSKMMEFVKKVFGE